MRWWSLSLAAILVGCGAESPSSSKSPVPIPPPFLTSLSIVPGDATIGIGEAVALTVLGTWINGTSSAVAVDWSLDDPTVAALTGIADPSNSVLGLAEGTCTITAKNTGLVASATLTVEWSISADPGPVYASASGRITRYLESAPPTTVATGSFGNGFVLDAAGDAIYTLVNAGGSAQAIDRIDPATGATETLGTGPMYHNSLSLGPDGRVFTTPLYTGGGTWISRFDPAAGTTRSFATIPADVLGSYGIYIPASVVIDRKGRATIGDFSGDAMWRYEDLNGDGDARDAGEITLFNSTRVNNQLFGTCVQAKR